MDVLISTLLSAQRGLGAEIQAGCLCHSCLSVLPPPGAPQTLSSVSAQGVLWALAWAPLSAAARKLSHDSKLGKPQGWLPLFVFRLPGIALSLP